MKITIDIPNKTIQIHGSFKYEDYQSMHKDLPLEWKGFTFEIVPVYVERVPWVYEPSTNPVIDPYRVTCTDPTYNSTLDALNGCNCNDVAEKPDDSSNPPNQPSLFDN
jgi:hypothetical protein